jgi:hypothetical protein
MRRAVHETVFCRNNGNHGLRSRFARNSEIIEATSDHGATDLWMKSNPIDRRFSFHPIWTRKLQDLCRIAFLTVVFWLCSCDANLFGPESREIAGGYRLKRAENPNQFVLTISHEDGGLILAQDAPHPAEAIDGAWWRR